MSKGLYFGGGFVLGGVLGSIGVYIYTRKEIKARIEKCDADMKAYKEKLDAKLEATKAEIKTEKKPDEKIQKTVQVPLKKKEVEKALDKYSPGRSKPNVTLVTRQELDYMEEYDQVNWTLYSNGAISDEDLELEPYASDHIGTDAANCIGMCGDENVICVANHDEKVGYILSKVDYPWEFGEGDDE